MHNEYGVLSKSQISHTDWERYDWMEVTRYGDREPSYVRGHDRSPPEPIVIKGQQRPGGPLIPRTEL